MQLGLCTCLPPCTHGNQDRRMQLPPTPELAESRPTWAAQPSRLPRLTGAAMPPIVGAACPSARQAAGVAAEAGSSWAPPAGEAGLAPAHPRMLVAYTLPIGPKSALQACGGKVQGGRRGPVAQPRGQALAQLCGAAHEPTGAALAVYGSAHLWARAPAVGLACQLLANTPFGCQELCCAAKIQAIYAFSSRRCSSAVGRRRHCGGAARAARRL